jgi:uncharacterized protein involved in outer membrane biogenesis
VSILKSPLTILGILLIITAGVLGLGPYFVNWEAHKAEFQRQASLVTGRDVTISGPLAVRLFPWPSLTADNVRISNPAGSLLADFAQVERVEAEISAPALLSGRIEFRKVRLLRPMLALERLAGGGTSWNINPERSLKGLPGADQIAVAGIDVVDGQIFLGDGRRGGLSEIASVNGRLSAPALDGPWRIQLDAQQGGTPFTLSASTGKYRRGTPLNVAVSIIPNDDTGFTWSFDGEALRDDGKVTGKLTLAPAGVSGGKANPLDSIWQVRITSDITADFDTVALRNIEVVPATDLAGGNLVTGEADISLGQQLDTTLRLSAANLDIDHLLGRNLLKSGKDGSTAAFLEAVSSVLEVLPADTSIRFDTGITSLIIGSETLTRVSLAGQLSPGSLRISEAVAGLPGQSRTSFSGILLPASNGAAPQLAGDFSIDSISMRDLVIWAVPDHAEAVGEVWAGARGRARISGRLGVTPDTLRLTGLKAQIDDATATGTFRITRGDEPVIAMRMVADQLNVDRYAPHGLSRRANDASAFSGLAGLASAIAGFGDAQLTIQTDSLVMRGVEAEDIAIDVDVSGGAVELRTIEIGGIGDARLDVAGVLNFPAGGIAGSVSGTFNASDPRPFLRLAGVLDAASSREPWAQRLGPVDLKVLSEISTGPGGSAGKTTLQGRAAGASIDVTALFDGQLASWRDGALSVDASVSGTSSANLLALAGIAPISGGDEPAAFKVSLAGKPSAALSGTASLAGFDTSLNWDGGFTLSPGGGIAGSGSVNLEAEDATALLAALGVDAPASALATSPAISARADAVLDGGSLTLDRLQATLPGNTASGLVRLGGSLRQPRIGADIELVHLDAGWFAGLLGFQPGGDTTSSGALTLTRLGWLDLPLKLKARHIDVLPGLLLNGGALVLSPAAGGSGVNFDLSGTTRAGGPFSLDLALGNEGPLVSADGRVSARIEAGNLLQTADGQPALAGTASLDMTFSGAGRTPAGLISQVSGQGKLSGGDFTLSGLDIAALLPKLSGLDSVEGLDRLMTGALSSGPLRAGLEDMPLTLTTGILRSEPVALSGNGASGSIRLVSDLAANRTRIDVALSATGKDVPEGMPGLSMRLSGHPHALERSYDTGSLKTWVVTNVLQQGMDRLEELQREEQRLIEEERKFREEQERKEAERRQRIIEERQAAEAARRRAAEERERLKSAEDVRRSLEAEEQRKLQDLIQQNLPADIPQDALLNPPPGSGATGGAPATAN